jgi:hypothetical protein
LSSGSLLSSSAAPANACPVAIAGELVRVEGRLFDLEKGMRHSIAGVPVLAPMLVRREARNYAARR